MSAFEELGVMPELIRSLEDMGWHLPTPPQTEAVPLILGGGDVAVAAETGAGKTGAFCLPVLQIVYETRNTNLAKLSDAPTGAAEEERIGPLRLSSRDRGKQVAVDEGGTVAQCRHPTIWEGVRATRGVARGKWYFVAVPRDEGICRVGWSSMYAQLVLGTDARGFGYGGTAMKSYAGKFDAYGKTYSKGDEICCMVEFAPGEDVTRARVVLSFAHNGVELGDAFKVSWKALGVQNMCLLPAASLKNAEVEIDFERSCSKAEELGFRPIREATLEDAEVGEEVVRLFKADEALALDDVMKDDDNQPGLAGENNSSPLALILEPSRELASQVEEELTKIGNHLPENAVRHLLLTGGGNPKTETLALRNRVDIVTGTLGSIMRQVKKGSFIMDNIRFFILDEADTFATENLRDVLFLHQKVPERNRVQTLMFSATLHSPEIRELSEKIQAFPTWVDLKGKDAVPETVHHTMVRLDADADSALLEEAPEGLEWPLDKVHLDKGSAGKHKKPRAEKGDQTDCEMLDAADMRSQTMKKLKLVALKKVIDSHSMSQAMLFVRTQQDGDNVESFLLQCSGAAPGEVNSRRFRGRKDSGPEVEYSCSVLHGGRRQDERNQALAAFKAGEVRFLVCTDVAARGIDIVGLPYLVNITLPDKSENYIHRVGRVGRAERLGLAVSLVSSQKEAVWYHLCKKAKAGVCNNRNLVSSGGCVMWYNESKLLEEIEERLKGRVEELGPNYCRKNADAALPMYGSRGDEEDVNAKTSQHIEQLQPAVRKLVRMEEDAQRLFFGLRQKYSFASSGS